MKKICFVVYDFGISGGVERVTANLANSLSDYFGIFIYNLSPFFERRFYECNEKISYFKSDSDALLITRIKNLVRFLKKEKIDVAILQGRQDSLCAFASLFCKTKFIFSNHLSVYNALPNKNSIRNYKIECFFADKITVLTDAEKNDFHRFLGIRKKKILVIPNWMPDLNIKTKFNDRTRIICVSRLSEEKRVDRLIDIMTLVKEKTDNWSLDVFGNGPLKEEIEEKISQNGLASFVNLKGEVSGLIDQYGNYDLCVLSSRVEGLPMCLLEAKSKGLPIISFDIHNGPCEIIDDGVNGYLIKDGNDIEYARRLIEMINNRRLLEKMSESSKLNCDKFSKENIIKKWKALIEEV